MADFADRLRFFEGLARAVRLAPPPLLLLIDDLQWCDRETLEWLHFLARFARDAPLLVLGTARSDELDGAHALPGLLRQLQASAQLVEIPLEPLDAAETARLAAAVAERSLDAAASTRLYRETEGNPLFVVETVRAQAAGGTPGAPARQLSGLPPRVHAVIAGRLAQLTERARDVIAAAAVVGRAFDLEVLVQLVGDEEAVVRALDELWRRRIVRERGPNAYDFTHDRLRDVAYGETSAPQRRHLHRRVAEALVARHGAELDPVAAAVAAHYDCAGLAEPAIAHYARAALVAQGLYAHEEAAGLAGRALALVPSLPPGPRRDARELELLLLLAPSLRVTLGWASPALEEALDRALSLCDSVGTPGQRVQALYGLQSLTLVAGRLMHSLQLAGEIARVAREASSTEPLHGAQAMSAGARLQMGRFSEASREIDALLVRADRRELQRFHDAQGINYEIHGLAWQSHGLWCLGRADTALEHGRRALALARELGQPFSQAIAATYLALLQQLIGGRAFRRQAAEALELATEFKATYYRAWAAILVSCGESLAAPEPRALDRLRATIDEFKATGARLRLPYYLGLLAEAHRRAGDAVAGLACVDEGLAHAAATGEHWWDAELERLRGELLLGGDAVSGRGGREEAEAALRRALEVARAQEALALELRAASSLARLWAAAGRRDEARALLAPVVSSFTEGEGTPDLEQARALARALTAG